MFDYSARAAVYRALFEDTAVYAAVGGRIYHGRAEQGTNYPFIVIESSSSNNARETNDKIRPSHIVKVHGYTTSVDTKDGAELKDAIFAALHRATLSPPEGDFVDCVQSGLNTFALGSDGDNYESVTEFEVIIEQR